jgi:putative flippase GtrA
MTTDKKELDKKSVNHIETIRVIKFSIGSILCFLADISLFWFIFKLLGWDYIVATIFAFLIAVSGEYFFDRRWTYPETKIKAREGYMKYMHAACIGLVAIAIFMWIGVDVLQFEEVRTRILIGLIVGIWNYVWNKRFTFNIPLTSIDKK